MPICSGVKYAASYRVDSGFWHWLGHRRSLWTTALGLTLVHVSTPLVVKHSITKESIPTTLVAVPQVLLQPEARYDICHVFWTHVLMYQVIRCTTRSRLRHFWQPHLRHRQNFRSLASFYNNKHLSCLLRHGKPGFLGICTLKFTRQIRTELDLDISKYCLRLATVRDDIDDMWMLKNLKMPLSSLADKN